MDGNNDPFLGGPLDLPADSSTPHKPTSYAQQSASHKRRRVLIIAILLFGILSVSGAAYYYLLRSESTQPAPANNTEPAISVAPVKADDVPAAGTIKDYNNGPLGVTLAYPDNWTVAATNDNGIRVESPLFTIKTVEQGDQLGSFRVYIRKGARPAKDSPIIGRGVALTPTEKLVYQNPAVGQRTDTLITTFGLDEPTAFNYFFVAGNFNLKKGDTLGPDYGQEPETYIIAGGYSGEKLAGDLDFYSVSPSIIKDSNAYAQALDIVRSLKLY